MKQRVPVSQIMAKALIVVNPTKKISDINQMFNDYGIRHIPVVEGTKLVGIISKSDVLKIGYKIGDTHPETLNSIYDTYELKDIMIHHPITVTADTNIKDVAEFYLNKAFTPFPLSKKKQSLEL